MNNSFVIEADERIEAKSAVLGERESELVRIIEAIRAIDSSEGWSTLKTLVFDGVLESLEHRLVSASNATELDQPEMYRLQGQIAWAKKYSNLDTLANSFRRELINVRSQLTPPTERVQCSRYHHGSKFYAD